MKVKELSELFEMRVTDLAIFTGYTRQALYNIIEGQGAVNIRRYDAMHKLLMQKAVLDYKREVEQAGKKFKERQQALAKIHNEQNRGYYRAS